MFHFDLLQNALEWPVFLDRIHELARKGALYRTDGKVLPDLGIRVVGGATVDLGELVGQRGASSAKYLYDHLATYQLTRMPTLADQRHRILEVLAEVLAAQVLDTRSAVAEPEAARLEEISHTTVEQLEQYHWPNGFYELVRFVRESLHVGRWQPESLQPAPMKKLKAFISYSSTDSVRARELYEWLVAHNVDPWELEIDKAINATDVVLICLSEDAIGKQGYLQAEIRRALDLVDRLPESGIYLIPVRLEHCRLPFRLSRYQYVDFFDPQGRAKLVLALRNRSATLGRAPTGSGRYLGATE